MRVSYKILPCCCWFVSVPSSSQTLRWCTINLFITCSFLVGLGCFCTRYTQVEAFLRVYTVASKIQHKTWAMITRYHPVHKVESIIRWGTGGMKLEEGTSQFFKAYNQNIIMDGSWSFIYICIDSSQTVLDHLVNNTGVTKYAHISQTNTHSCYNHTMSYAIHTHTNMNTHVKIICTHTHKFGQAA